MANEQQELDEILATADPAVDEVITAYEPLEALYRRAYGSDEILVAASDTTMMPRAIVDASPITR